MRYHQRKQKEASAPRDMELMDEVAQLRQKLSEARQENRALTREKKKWEAVERHLRTWLDMQTSTRTHDLYTAGLRYFGLTPAIPD